MVIKGVKARATSATLQENIKPIIMPQARQNTDSAITAEASVPAP